MMNLAEPILNGIFRHFATRWQLQKHIICSNFLNESVKNLGITFFVYLSISRHGVHSVLKQIEEIGQVMYKRRSGGPKKLQMKNSIQTKT